MRIRLELFVKSVPESKDFYARVLGFDVINYQPNGYSVFRKGAMQISLEAQANLPNDHPIKPMAGERAGLGIEIVLEVDDLDAMYDHFLNQNWPLSNALEERPWGRRDFRVLDPDGYYIRITETK